MQTYAIKRQEIINLEADKAKVTIKYKKLESDRNLLTLELRQLEEIKQQNVGVSDSISLDMEIIAREEELRRVLEEKIEQESRTRIEAWKIQQELQIREVLRATQDGEIPGLRPGQKPEITTTQIQLEVPMGSNHSPNSNLGILEEALWDQKYLATLRGEETQEISTLQKAAPDSLPFQGPYSPFSTLSLQNLGAGPFALGAMQPQAPVQDLSSSNQPLAPTQTSLQYPPQNPQVNAPPPFDQVASSRKLPAETSSIFMRASDANLVPNDNPENHIIEKFKKGPERG